MPHTPYTSAVARYIALCIRQHRYAFSDERGLHQGIAHVLSAAAFDFKQEYRLSKEDRVDFFLPNSGIVVEVKVKGSGASLLEQLERYAQHDAVRGIIVVTTRLFLGVPLMISDKPVERVVLLSL